MKEIQERLIPVLDVRKGVVVHGIGGQRESYQPIRSCWVDSADPLAVLQALDVAYRPGRFYLADLDCIENKKVERELMDRLAAKTQAIILWDAGFREPGGIPELPINVRPILALESLPTWDDFQAVFSSTRTPVIFSLDLKDNQPWHTGHGWGYSAVEIARQIADVGIRECILLDVRQVGGNQGLAAFELFERIRQSVPEIRWITGGGIRSWEDCRRIAADGYLVASAIHTGALPPLPDFDSNP